MPLNPDVKTLHAAVGIANDTTAGWAANDAVLFKGQLGMDTDTGVVKIGDGVKMWSELSPKIDAPPTQAQKTLLDKAGAADGVATLDGTGKISMSMLPTGVVAGAVKYVADIAARDALAGDQRNGLIFVIDAVGDATVTARSAQYTWDGSKWDKVGETESMDINFDTMLAPYHKVSDTVEVLLDGDTKCLMLKTERADLADLKAHAIRDDHVVFIPGPTAAELAGMVTP